MILYENSIENFIKSASEKKMILEFFQTMLERDYLLIPPT